MVSYKKQIIFLIISAIVCIAFFFSIYNEVKRKTVEELNNRQMVYARLAAKGIEAYFIHQLETLSYLAQNEHVVLVDQEGKALMRSVQEIADNYVEGVTRLDARGKIIYSFPYVKGIIGTDVSKQEHIRDILQNKKPVISDVFVSVQGFQAVAIHVPVYRGKAFDGTLAFLISFESLAKKYLVDIKIDHSGYAWMISAKGIEIYCPIPGHVGNSVFKNCKDFPEIIAMAREMMKGKTGATTYIFEKTGEDVRAKVKKHAVYMPVKIGNTFWSIVVATPADTVLAPMKNFRNQLIVIALILLLVFAAMAYVAARIRSTAIEQQKSRNISENLIKTAREVHDLYNNAPCGYHSLDPNGNIIRMNDTELAWLDYRREELIGKPFKNILSADGCRIFDRSFPELVDKGSVKELAYDMVRKDGSAFPVLINASALKDESGHFIMSRAMVLDMTIRKQAEDRLRESEELYRTALESTNDGISITQNGKYVYVNKNLMKTIGRPDENIIGMTAGMYIHPEDRQFLLENYLAISKNETLPHINYDLRVIKPDESIVIVNVTAIIITYNGNPAVLAFMMDVTEKKRTEEALRESEALYRTALEASNDGVSIIQDGKYVYANQKLLNTIGRPDENMIGQPLGIFIHPDDQESVIKMVEARFKGESTPSRYELRAVKPDNSIIILSITAVLIIYKGKPAAFAYIQDITERKQTEIAIQESEALYRKAMETTNDGITIIQDGKYAYINQRLLNTLGRPNENMIGQPLGMFIHPDDLEVVRKRNRDRLTGEPVPANYDFRIIKPDKSTAIINVNSVTIIYKGRPATLTFIKDITEQKNAEAALRQSEERYRTIIESIDDDYFETDLDGTITFLNKPYDWSGRSRAELVGLNHRQYTTPEMAEKASKAFRKIYRDGKPARIIDYQTIRKNGNIGHLEMSVSLMRNAEGIPVGFRGISRDVSERFKMEEERNKLTEQLYQAQKMEAIGTLAGGIAHDFNNLLMGIQGYTSLMLLEVDKGHPYYGQLTAMQTLVQSGASLTRQLLGFARAGRYEVVPTNLNDLINKSVNLFGRTRKEIRIFEKYAAKIWTVETDRGQIEQVLLNIFVNAWQAMPGGGSLYLETENVVTDETLAKFYDLKPGRYVKTSITDTGVGMDEKTRLRIFDPFFTTKEMGRGTGLGLASAYGIIKGHGGLIAVYSEKGQGTTFNIYLPASLKEVDTEEPAESELSGGRETILLVDDEEVITDVTGKLLTELGYKIITAGNGEAAIAIYAQKHADIDLVIIDMIMPGMGGSDTFDQLKAINPSVRVILSSGYSINGKAQDIMDKGARVFLQKPYRLHDLAKKIREALSV